MLTLNGHTDLVRALAVLNNGDLASGSADTTIKVWNATSEKLKRTIKGHTSWVSSLNVFK